MSSKTIIRYWTAVFAALSLFTACDRLPTGSGLQAPEGPAFSHQGKSSWNYNGGSAVRYALANWNRRYGPGPNDNPFRDYSTGELGGNCTNFASQVIAAGLLGYTSSAREVYARRGEFLADRGHNYSMAWYWLSDTDRGPAWTGVRKLFEYAKGNKHTYAGLHFAWVTSGRVRDLRWWAVEPGDIVFMDFQSDNAVDHAGVVTEVYRGREWQTRDDRIRATYQTVNAMNVPLDQINGRHAGKVTFYIYRPVNYSAKGR